MAAVLPVVTSAGARAVVGVRAPGRLHLGFLDPAGSLGRRWGSVGLVIDGYVTEVEIGPAGVDTLSAGDADAERELDRSAALLQTLRRHTGITSPVALRLVRMLPAHAGFGSGTQLALAIGRAFVRAHGLEVPTATLGAWLGRGERSGIGVAGFDQGGLLVDGGPGASGRPAPLLARLALPADWCVVVVEDRRGHGLAGAAERAALAELPPLPASAAAEICHQTLMRVLAGAAAGDFDAFAGGVGRIQQILGEHFAPVQRDSAWTSRDVGAVLQRLERAATRTLGIGQSSWGPTGFAFAPSTVVASRLLETLPRLDPALGVQLVGVRNRGATVVEHPAR
jgi:beta-ribofuranosylaminobenzene 5'-phosphate synthase